MFKFLLRVPAKYLVHGMSKGDDSAPKICCERPLRGVLRGGLENLYAALFLLRGGFGLPRSRVKKKRCVMR